VERNWFFFEEAIPSLKVVTFPKKRFAAKCLKSVRITADLVVQQHTFTFLI